jgi:hypothetical protein
MANTLHQTEKTAQGGWAGRKKFKMFWSAQCPKQKKQKALLNTLVS